MDGPVGLRDLDLSLDDHGDLVVRRLHRALLGNTLPQTEAEPAVTALEDHGLFSRLVRIAGLDGDHTPLERVVSMHDADRRIEVLARRLPPRDETDRRLPAPPDLSSSPCRRR